MTTAENKKSIRFWEWAYYPLATVIIAMLGSLFQLEGVCAFILVCLISLTLIFSAELSSTILPFLLICQLSGSGVEDYYSFGAWLIAALPLFFFSIVYNIVKFKKRFIRGQMLLPLIFVSLAVTLGGVGGISSAEYFRIGGILHTVLLGVGMLALYILVKTLWHSNAQESLRESFCDAMVYTSLYCVFYLVVHRFFPSLSYVAGGQEQLPALGVGEFANNVSLFLVLCLPFIFGYAMKNNAYTLLSWVVYAAIASSGSRTGILFGGIVMAVCYLWLIIKKEKYRIFNTVLLCCIVIAGFLVLQHRFASEFSTGTRILFFSTSDVRFKLVRRSIIDFFSAPIFGRGIGYIGNYDIYAAQPTAMHWYHNFISQIFGSLGLVGAAAYLYMFLTKIRLLKTEKSTFSGASAICYFALLLCSLTEPGIFSPIPCATLITFAFIMLEMKEKKDV